MDRSSIRHRIQASWLGLLPNTHQVLFAFCTLVAAIEALSLALSMDAGIPNSLRVFGSLWTSGRAATLGLNPYAAYDTTWVFHRSGLSIVDLNLNPPLLLPLLQAFASVSVVSAARCLIAVSTITFVVTVAGLLRNAPYRVTRIQILWLFAASAFQDTLALGQIYILLFSLSAMVWLCLMRGRINAAGLAIGLLVALKPTLLIWPVYLFLAGHRRVALVAAATATGLTILSVAAYGPGVAMEWLTALAADRHGVIPTEASLQGYWMRLDQPRLGSALALALVLGCGAWARRRRADVLEASGLAIAVAILVAPLSWFHYTLFLIPALLTRPWGRTLHAAALLLCIPVSVPLLALIYPGWGSATFGAIYMAGVILILVDLVRHPIGVATPPRSTSPVADERCPVLHDVAAAEAA